MQHKISNQAVIFTENTIENCWVELKAEGKKINFGESPVKDLPVRCAITIIICNSDGYSIPYLGNAQSYINFINRKKKIIL